ncbi:Lrp/AsnC family transcriptional regulator [Segeticoccus rhizosphaerae]|uniref:Lrp/AsnC family transcriptional regulator n=1 Tax=Segeticoccus rhizosphaerae TaxID=1104777 RepID=UPI0012647DEB|nr:Lrp/AsnC family transcriptional regulator [Segeticoccus rhizosphaerae]
MLDNDGLDPLDTRIITVFTEQPGIGVLGASRTLGVARGTVQARLDRLERRGVLTSFAPHVEPSAMGYPVTAFCTLEIRQSRGHDPVVAHLRRIPEVLEAHTITGQGDLMIRVVAQDNAHLQHVIDRVVAVDQVERAATVIALATQIPYRTLPLVQLAAPAQAGPGDGKDPAQEGGSAQPP